MQNELPVKTHPYPAYKDSGVEWLERIPSHWDKKPLFAVMKEREIKNKNNQVQNVLSLSYGKIIRRDISTNYGLFPESFETYQIVGNGNIILRLTDLQNDKRSLRVGLVKEIGIITSAYTCLQTQNGIDSTYVYYLLHNYDLWKIFYNLGNGVRQSMDYKDLKHLPILIPPLSEQRAIADFLDRETARIDALIAKYQRLIELLEEKRTSLISQAVTKGLDASVEMKNSGVEWLGKIPVKWIVAPIRYRLQNGNNGIRIGPFGSELKSDIFFETGIKVYGQENIINDDFARGNRFIDNNKFLELSAYELFPDDIVISMMGTTGRCKVVPENIQKGIMDSHLVRLRTLDDLLPKYLALLVDQADYVRYQINASGKGAIMQGLNSSIIKSIQIAIPPIEEQRLILHFLEQKTVSIDAGIKTIKNIIGSLQEFRSTLISAAVTGKIDVRN